ncbi:MAG: hypothetical protein WCL08_12760, partial [Verrucomicrobiota bacterium]
TGWFPGKYDGKMRWEVPDEGASLKSNFGKATKVSDLIDHPALFAAYPSIADTKVEFRGFTAGITKDGKVLVLPAMTAGFGVYNSALLEGVLHETQHLIQAIEEFARGGTPEMAYDPEKARISQKKAQLEALRDEAKAAWDANRSDANLAAWKASVDAVWEVMGEKPAKLSAESKIDYYNRIAGEIESRDVQARQNFTPEQRKAVEPYSSENIAKEDAIVMHGGGPQMSIGGRVTPEQEHKTEDRLTGYSDSRLAQQLPTKAVQREWINRGILPKNLVHTPTEQEQRNIARLIKVARENRFNETGTKAANKIYDAMMDMPVDTKPFVKIGGEVFEAEGMGVIGKESQIKSFAELKSENQPKFSLKDENPATDSRANAHIIQHKSIPVEMIDRDQDYLNPDIVSRYEDAIRRGQSIDPPLLMVNPKTGRFTSVDGHHRIQAYKNLGITNIAAAERAMPPGQKYEIEQGLSIVSDEDTGNLRFRSGAESMGARQGDVSDRTGGGSESPEAEQAGSRRAKPDYRKDRQTWRARPIGLDSFATASDYIQWVQGGRLIDRAGNPIRPDTSDIRFSLKDENRDTAEQGHLRPLDKGAEGASVPPAEVLGKVARFFKPITDMLRGVR